MQLTTLSAAIVAGALAAPCLAAAGAPAPKKPIDVMRYAGRWHEIARFPNKAEATCEAPTADYILTGEKLSLVQTCRDGSPTGPEKVYRASARILDPGSNTKLKLTYFAIITREYWVLDRADDYSWALVGEPSGKFLWLMARASNVSADQRKVMTRAAAALGYDIAQLEFPRQGG